MENEKLATCHRRLTQLFGQGMEPIDVIRRVQAHRVWWRPSKVRLVLLAESHVYTSPDDLARKISPNEALPCNLPPDFVRLVYCLGYGEDHLLDKPILQPRNGGTPQFWKLFYSCVNQVRNNNDFASVLVTRTPFSNRIANKVDLLTELQRHGIWLVDASITALYVPGQTKPDAGLIGQALQLSWDYYIADVIKTCQPEGILCVGLGVWRHLSTRLRSFGIPVGAVPAPNAHLDGDGHLQTFQKYYDVCRNPRQVSVIAPVP
jgi:hypothetical protein